MNGTLRRGRYRLTCFRGWRADRADYREDLVLLDEHFGRFDGFLRLIAIVERQQFKPAAGNAAVAIGIVEGGQDALAHAFAEILGRPRKRRDLAEQDFLIGDAVFGTRGIAGNTEEKTKRERKRNAKLIAGHWRDLHCLNASRRAPPSRYYFYCFSRARQRS